MSADERQQQHPTERDHHASVLMEVSNTMVRLFKDQFGRGPTAARTHWAGEDTLVCILEDTFTPAERNLVRMGEHQRLRDLRLFFQYASVREFCEPVEQITGRTIRSFQSSTDTEAEGLSIEVFIFWPKGKEGASRIERADL